MDRYRQQRPNKVLLGVFTKKVDLEPWPYQDFPDDLYWDKGSAPKPYKWLIDVSIGLQVHGDPTTREPFRYDGNDVFVGNWVADLEKGISLKITQVIEKSTNFVKLVVEDVDRYNTFQDENGFGLFPIPSDVVIFEINDDNLPVLNPMPAEGSVTFTSEVFGKFQNNNPLYRYRFIQENHGFQQNQSVWVNPDTGVFELATGDNLKALVGTIDQVGPGEDIFYLIPSTKIIEGIEPNLPGKAGDIIYADSITGEFTTTSSSRAKPVYIQLTDSTPDKVDSNTDSPIITQGNVVKINTYDVTFSSTSMQSVVDDINAKTSDHSVTAELKSAQNTTSTVSGNLSYGICACIGISASCNINGVTVLFNDDTNGSIEYGFSAVNAVDMANSINSSDIPNITATGIGSTSLTIINSIGGAITITNLTNDDSSVPFAGPSSCCGIELNTPAGGTEFMSFTNIEGTGIIFANKVGLPVEELGLTSVRNGEAPKGLVVEQNVITTQAGIKVYATLDDLPSVSVVGEQAFVIDSTDVDGNNVGEWSMFVWDGDKWILTADEDSAATDANSAKLELTNVSSGSNHIVTMSDGSRVTIITVEVTTPFDDGTSSLIIQGQNNLDTEILMGEDMIDLTSSSTYTTTTDVLFADGGDIDVSAILSPEASTVGEVIVTISYQ